MSLPSNTHTYHPKAQEPLNIKQRLYWYVNKLDQHVYITSTGNRANFQKEEKGQIIGWCNSMYIFNLIFQEKCLFMRKNVSICT